MGHQASAQINDISKANFLTNYACMGTNMYQHRQTNKKGILRTFTLDSEKTIQCCEYYKIRKQQLRECSQIVQLLDYQIVDTNDDTKEGSLVLQTNHKHAEYRKVMIMSQIDGGNLEQEITNRKNKAKFEQVELWSVLSSCVIGACSMLEMGLKEPVLSPKAITLTQNGHIKVGDWETICDNTLRQQGQIICTPNINKNSINWILMNYYWPPEGFGAVEQVMSIGCINKRDTTKIDQCKSQIFSLGMTLLSMGFRENLYQKETYSERKLNHLLQLLKQQMDEYGISEQFFYVLESMLKWDPSERISYRQLKHIVLSHLADMDWLKNSQVLSLSTLKNSAFFQSGNGESSLGFVEAFEGSGMIQQGLGDNYEPEEQQFNEAKSKFFTQKTKRLIPLIHDQEDKADHEKWIWDHLGVQQQNPDIFQEQSTSRVSIAEQINISLQNGWHTNNFIDQNSPRKRKNEAILINESNDEQIFTDPKLLSYIRSEIETPSKKQKQNSGIIGNLLGDNGKLVKEQFRKGWYQGEKKNGMRNGYGVFHYKQGGKYRGNWLNNQMHGKGTLEYPDGRVAYQGQWNRDELNGKGILYNQSPSSIFHSLDYHNFDHFDECWVYYDGEFQNDDKHGKGLLLLSNGQQFLGQFMKDMVNGYGEYTCSSGQVIKGYWKDNKIISIIQ